MNYRPYLLLICISAFCPAAPAADGLADVLNRMDQSAETFQGMTANMTQTDYTAVLNDKTVQTGTVKVKKVRAKAIGLIDFAEPNPRTVALKEGEVQVYYPGIKEDQIFDVREYGQQLDQFLLLGFGTSGKDLQNIFDVKLGGSETVQGTRTVRLDLFPKSKQARDLMDKVELWIPEGASYPVQEKIYTKSGNYKLIAYSNVKLNPGLTEKDVELSLPPGVTRRKMQ